MDRLKLAIESLQTHIDYNNREKGMQTGLITIGIAEAEALLEILKEQEAEIEQLNRFVNGFSRDAIPVVRCKDCKQSGIDSTSYPQYWCSAHSEYHDDDWFCADGERKESW